jgi:hypothetical protein
MSYINTRAESEAAEGSAELTVPRYTPLNPIETPDSGGEFPSGVIDTSHAIRVGDIVFSASNAGVADSSRVVSVVATDSEITTIEVDKPFVSSINAGTWLTFDRFQNTAPGAKVSFAKFPVPSISDQVPLFDIVSGQVLTDQAGVELVTDTEIAVAEVASKDNATSITLPTDTSAPSVPVEEIFQETSEVSNTLLGVPRAEEQLSLFSDVSTLGLNEDDWEFFTQTGGLKFGPWDTRESEIFGNHYNASFIEQTDEQALELGAFPVPYSYPFGERWANLGLYNEQRYAEYVNFIRLGNDLYTYFSTTEREEIYGADFKNNFLDGSKVFINAENDTEFVGVSSDEGFKLIDTWTRTWVDINDGIFLNPASPGAVFDPVEINRIVESDPLFSNTRPGYNTNFQRFSYLQSKRAYRYQPGRVSGFTFGLRASSDSGSESNVLEWGITNPTDQYAFQIRGASLNIVRRSTIPLDADVVRAQGLDPVQDQTLEPSGDPGDVDPQTGNTREYFTIAIPRDNWNVDPLNGNGPSGYLLTTEEVTMYKIEFSWYGAIGARFYVYTPAGNGEARWILVHVLVIENKLGEPCLEDPDFRFRYSLNIRDTARLRTPQFVYKYGASCYIDGGDEGTVTLQSYQSGTRSINSTSETSLLGVYPKEFILNQQGYEKTNKKVIVPKSLNVTSDELARVQIGKCKACPGFGHNYNLGLKSSQVGRTANFKFNDDTLSSITINPDIDDKGASDLFQLDDNDAKIIANGIYSTYIQVDEESDVRDSASNIIGYTSANLKRIVSNSYEKEDVSSVSSPSAPTSGFDSTGIVILNDGSQRNLFDYAGDEGATYPDQMRLSRFSDAIAASDIPLTGTEIDVQFLNPSPRDTGGVFSDFMIGITDKKPTDDAGVLKFEVEPTEFEEDISEEDSLFGEYTQSTTSRNRLGQERGEANFPFEEVFEIDHRIPRPEKEDSTDKSGDCSLARFSIQDRVQIEGTFTTTNPDPESSIPGGENYLVLDEGFAFPNGTIRGGEIGISGEGSGVTITSEAESFISDGVIIQYVTVSGFPTGFSDGSPVTAELTPITITGTHVNELKVFKFNPYPLYLFVKMRDNSAINSISIKERVGKTTVTSTPNWIFTFGGNMDTDDSGGRAQPNLTPLNFVEKERLDSASIDNQNSQRLRPLRIKDAFYVGKQESKEVDLDAVYGFDREVITPDIFDTEATFIVAETVEEPTGEIQVTLNTSEQ